MYTLKPLRSININYSNTGLRISLLIIKPSKVQFELQFSCIKTWLMKKNLFGLIHVLYYEDTLALCLNTHVDINLTLHIMLLSKNLIILFATDSHSTRIFITFCRFLFMVCKIDMGKYVGNVYVAKRARKILTLTMDRTCSALRRQLFWK